jgi:hypothetical protein
VLLEFIGRHLIKCIVTYRLTLPSKQSVCHLLQFLQPHITAPGPWPGVPEGAALQPVHTWQQSADQPYRNHLLPLLNCRSREQLIFKNVSLCSVTERS